MTFAQSVTFELDGLAIGHVANARVDALLAALPTLSFVGGALRWRPRIDPTSEITAAALALRAYGAVAGWRDERYRCERPVGDPCREFGAELFTLERAAFRTFGLMSRAVHINGRLPDGRWVCGRRAMTKATDPGKLDNLAAGGLMAGEDLLACARRELLEEAGVPALLSALLGPRGAIRATRWEVEGLHDEVLHIYDLALPDGFEPSNRDGEVSEFVVLDAHEARARLTAGEFSPDAAAVMEQALQRLGDDGGSHG